ncbi:MAG TPA: SRPBCC family protein [Actinoplanes sp.]|nr:SRPBCC family protein [Actinoplanes sp.]
MSVVQQAIEVSAPLHTVYEQLAAFENYPQFMSGVREVTPIGDDRTHWIMDVEGKRREFDAQIIERSPDERVSWATTEGPLLAETITLRPMGEMKTQVVAQLEADVAFLMPGDRHGQVSLNKRLKADLNALKGLVERGASTKKLVKPVPTPAALAARARSRPHPGAGWGTGAAERGNASSAEPPYHGRSASTMGTSVDITSAPGIKSVHDLDDVLAPGRRIAPAGSIGGGAAPMGGRTTRNDAWGDDMMNVEDRGSAHDL